MKLALQNPRGRSGKAAIVADTPVARLHSWRQVGELGSAGGVDVIVVGWEAVTPSSRSKEEEACRDNSVCGL